MPAERTKTGKEHWIPLSNEALNVFRAAANQSDQSLLFPTSRGNPMTDAAMSSFMNREGYKALGADELAIAQRMW